MIPSCLVAPVVLILVACTGCGRTWRGDIETASATSAVTGCDIATLWESTDDVLRNHDFKPEIVDRRAGRITTRPVVSQHFFEFWRRDVASLRDRWEATISPLRRWCEIRLETGAEPNPGSFLTVTVHKERLSSPDRQFTSSAAAYHFFRDRLPAARSGLPIEPAEVRWIDAGRDPIMERLLLDRILARSGTCSAGPPGTESDPVDELPESGLRPDE